MLVMQCTARGVTVATTVTYRGHRFHVKARTHDWAARVDIPKSHALSGAGYRDFFGPSQLDVEQQARDFIKSLNPWRDANEEECEESGVA